MKTPAAYRHIPCRSAGSLVGRINAVRRGNAGRGGKVRKSRGRFRTHGRWRSTYQMVGAAVMTVVITRAPLTRDDEGMRVAGLAVWDRPDIVGGFVRSAPNAGLIEYARRRRCPWASTRVLDIGCGAGRNAVPLAAEGFDVIGVDQSQPMLAAAAARVSGGRLTVIEAAMDDLPIQSRSIDLLVAHGIWNLARSDAEFHRALEEAARVAATGAALFVFTFSRSTLSPDATPADGQRFVFTQFSGEPQVFLTRDHLLTAMRAVGFIPDPEFAMRELNIPPAGQLRIGGAPVILEAGFRFRGA